MHAEESGHFRGGGDGQMGVLSIAKLVAGQGAYYDLQVAHGRDDYYPGRSEAPGRWTGGAAARLGLAGEVGSAGVAALLEGRDPSTGETRRRGVSVRFAIAEPEVRGALVARGNRRHGSPAVDYMLRIV